MFFLDKILESISSCIRRNVAKTAENEQKSLIHNEISPELDLFRDSNAHDHNSMHLASLASGSRGQKILGGLMLWISLVLHSFFEGLGLGSATNEKFIDLFIAVIAHHLISALLLGSILQEKGHNIFLSLFFILSLAISLPIGLTVGIFASSFESIGFVFVQGISLALASGVFCYVSCFEILANFDPTRGVLLVSKIGMFVVGFVAIVIVIIV